MQKEKKSGVVYKPKIRQYKNKYTISVQNVARAKLQIKKYIASENLSKIKHKTLGK